MLPKFTPTPRNWVVERMDGRDWTVIAEYLFERGAYYWLDYYSGMFPDREFRARKNV